MIRYRSIAVLMVALALPEAAVAQHQPVVVPAEASVVIPARGAAPLGQAPAVRRVRRSYSLPVARADRIENFAQEKSAALMAYLRGSSENLSAFLAPIGAVRDFSDIDGLRVTLADDSVIHFRPSGNAPEMRCYVEAKSVETADALLARGLERIATWQAPA